MRIGIDLGETKIEAVALDSMGEVVTRHRAPTMRDSSAEVLVEIASLVMVIESEIAGASACRGEDAGRSFTIHPAHKECQFRRFEREKS